MDYVQLEAKKSKPSSEEVRNFFSAYSKLSKVAKKLDKIKGKENKGRATALIEDVTAKMEELAELLG